MHLKWKGMSKPCRCTQCKHKHTGMHTTHTHTHTHTHTLAVCQISPVSAPHCGNTRLAPALALFKPLSCCPSLLFFLLRSVKLSHCLFAPSSPCVYHFTYALE